MKDVSKNKNSKIYEEIFKNFRDSFINDLGICKSGTKKLVHYLSDECDDIQFLIECHNTISHKWKDIIFTTAQKYIDDPTKWCIYYDGSLLHNAVIDSDGIWLDNTQNFKFGNTKRHMNHVFDVDTDYFLFYKILGKYLFLEKQGLKNQIWTKDMKELIIELKRTQIELDQYKKGIL